MTLLSLLLGIICIWIKPSLQAAPYISPTVTWNVYEDAEDDHLIDCVPCIHPAPVTVTIVSVTVHQGTPRCTTCFSLRKISPVSGFCLHYSRNTLISPPETLDFNYAKRYSIRVECSSGAEFTQEDLDIRIVPNAAPLFSGAFATGPLTTTCPSPIDASSPVGTHVYTGVTATDKNGDTIEYSMTSYPPNEVFDIDSVTGIIYAVNPVSGFCHRTVIFYVYISDNKKPPTGPLTVTCQISNYNSAPMVSNVNRDFYVDEDAAVGSTVFTFLTPTNPLPVTYTIDSAQPTTAGTLFSTSGNRLEVASTLNYEDLLNRNPNITITATNGQCPPEEFYLHIHIQDKNDPPVPTPKTLTHTAAEGAVISLNLDTAISVADEDVEDSSFKYRITAGNPSNLWTVTASNDLVSISPYDLETHGTGATLTLEVTDTKGPATDTFTVTIAITDINDNPPIFTQTAYSFTASECTTAGTVLGSLAATDADSNVNNNNVISFGVVAMNSISVDASGQVRLLAPVTLGSTPSVTIQATDQGTPSLSSPWQAVVSLVVTPCPSPATAPPGSTTDQCGDNGSSVYNFWLELATFVAALVHNSR